VGDSGGSEQEVEGKKSHKRTSGMAGGKGNRGGGDRVLESRHLVGLFLSVVLLCGVFFSLGYVMGRTQFGGPVQASETLAKSLRAAPPESAAAKAKEKGKESEGPSAPASGEWDFYSKKNANDRLEPATKPAAPAPVTAAAARKNGPAPAPSAVTKTIAANAKPSARFQAPSMGKGAIVLQLAALTRESDALALADALQQKKFPSFVVTPAGDTFYRVQVGPYSDVKSAEAAKAALDREGFKAIIKR
jgi:cell division septation protein DedD